MTASRHGGRCLLATTILTMTLIGWWLAQAAYSLHWIVARHAFLADQVFTGIERRSDTAAARRPAYSLRGNDRRSGVRTEEHGLPWSLWMFCEAQVDVIVIETDLGPDGTSLAARLFPEARIMTGHLD
jgi:hypothetical protein